MSPLPDDVVGVTQGLRRDGMFINDLCSGALEKSLFFKRFNNTMQFNAIDQKIELRLRFLYFLSSVLLFPVAIIGSPVIFIELLLYISAFC